MITAQGSQAKLISLLARTHRLFAFCISWFRYTVFATELSGIKFVAALACTSCSVFIGLAYAKWIYIEGWQFGSWAACVLILPVMLIPPLQLRMSKTWLIFPALFLAALAFRLPMLDTIPGGLHVDEVGVADFALHQIYTHFGETISPFVTGPASQPTMFHYLIRLTLALFGPNISALRVSSAVAGSVAVLATYAAVASLQNRVAALFTAIFMAGFHYHIHWSRIALNNIWDTVWVPSMVAAYVWGWKKGWSGGAVLAGLAFGMSQYFYAGSKIGIFLMAFLILWLWRQETPLKSRAIYLGKFAITTICVAAPMAFFIIFNLPTYMLRPSETFGWGYDAIRIVTGTPINLPAYIWYQISHSLGAYTLYPDVTGFYRPGIPFLIGIAAPLFIFGFFWAIYKRLWVPVLWILLVSFFGGFMLGGNPSSSHYVASIPAICWLVSLPLYLLYKAGHGRLALLLLAIMITSDLNFYFNIYVPAKLGDLSTPFPPFP